MPVVDPERWLVLEPLLDRALELSDDERDAWLRERIQQWNGRPQTFCVQRS